jgi:hypothetical protein
MLHGAAGGKSPKSSSSENWISHNSGQISTYNTTQYFKINFIYLYNVVKVMENECKDVRSMSFTTKISNVIYIQTKFFSRKYIHCLLSEEHRSKTQHQKPKKKVVPHVLLDVCTQCTYIILYFCIC